MIPTGLPHNDSSQDNDGSTPVAQPGDKEAVVSSVASGAHLSQVDGRRAGKAWLRPLVLLAARVMYKLTRKFLFRRDAEKVHDLAVRSLNRPIIRYSMRITPEPICDFLGMPLRGRLGLAAGFFKFPADAPGLMTTEFGFAELGSITLEPQSGNPKPRLFRIPEQEQLLNRFGFNNPGALQAAASLQWLRENAMVDRPIWINVGKSKRAETEQASIADIATTYNCLQPYADAMVINVASPNTPGLRALLAPRFMEQVLEAVDANSRTKPLLLKTHPDFEAGDWDALVEWLRESPVDGVVCSNTTIDRTGIFAGGEAFGPGGMSGRGLGDKVLPLIRDLRQKLPERIRIVGCGGIMDLESARAFLAAGADVVEAYSGWIYGGPGWEGRINRELR